MGPTHGVAVAAVGGYGRGELAPFSDIDLLFLVDRKAKVAPSTLRGVLYPLWDEGAKVGHAAVDPKEAIERARRDLDAATALLSARFIGGDETQFSELTDRRSRWLARDGKDLARRIRAGRSGRHRVADRAGWSLAPDIKEGVGGMRDVHAIQWLARLTDGDEGIPGSLTEHYEVLLWVREALHATAGRKLDVVRIDLQPALASALGVEGDGAAEDLMVLVHSAARSIEHEGGLEFDQLVERVLGGPRRSGSIVSFDEVIRIEDGSLRLAREDASIDAATSMSVIAASSQTGRPLARRTMRAVEEGLRSHQAEQWPKALRDAFFEVMRGDHVTEALELLDHLRAWPVLLPEWMGVRGLVQHDPYHRYTVDGHSFLAVGEIRRVLDEDPIARAAIEETGDEVPLRLATLLHDIGKGSGSDHSVVGEELARAACVRIGVPSTDIDHVAALVRWHLLLVDTATRRDLDDGLVIEDVAAKLQDPQRLRWLYVLSAADGRATGPEAWGEWKTTLVRELYRKVLAALETGVVPVRSDVSARAREVEAFEPALSGRVEDVLATLPHSYLDATSVPDIVDDVRLLLSPPQRGEVRHRIEPAHEAGLTAVTVCVPDRRGTLARAAGVLALHRIAVFRAQAYSTSSGLALERFIVQPPAPDSLELFGADLEAAYSGRLALEARLAKKMRDYHSRSPDPPDVRMLQDASEHSTVIEVRAADTLGLLYALAAALTDLDLDIHVAKIDTLGDRVVDVFYVRTPTGEKLSEDQFDEARHAIQHRAARLLGA